MLYIDDYYELLALQRSLMEVRYLATNVNTDLRGSPFLSRLHERTLDAIEEYLEGGGKFGELGRWRKWREFENRRAQISPPIMEYLAQLWSRLPSHELKRETVVHLFRPFRYVDSDVARMISDLDELAGETEGNR